MKKRFASILAAMAVATITVTASAVKFAEVPNPSEWDYEAINELTRAGIITSYTTADVTARHAISRMEMASLVADAIRKGEKADVQQKSIIIKLAREYKPELEQIAQIKGIRKPDLRKALGISYGEVRLRYMNGPALTNVHRNSIENMVPKVGPDVGEQFDNNPKVEQAIVDALGSKETQEKLLGALKESSKDPVVFGKKMKELQQFITTGENGKYLQKEMAADPALARQIQGIEGLATAYGNALASGNAAQIAAVKQQAMQQIQRIMANPNSPANKKLLRTLAKVLPIINDFDRNKREHQYDVRLRVNVFGVMTPKTKALARVQADLKYGDTHTSEVKFDRLMLVQRVGIVDFVVGRQGVRVGDGLTYNDYFDGALATVKKGNTRYTLAHGWPSFYKGQYAVSEVDPASMAYVLHAGDGKLQATFVEVDRQLTDNVGAKVYFMKGNNGIPVSAAGAALKYSKDKLWVGGEYAKLLDVDKLPQPYGLLSSLLSDDYAYTIGAGYGNFLQTEKGSWDVSLRYLFEGRVAPVMNSYTFDQPFINNYKAWNLKSNYVINKNFYATFNTFFNGKSSKGTEKYDNSYSLSLNYTF